MLRARHALWLAVLGLAGASLGASCTGEQRAPDAAPARRERDDRPLRTDRRVLRVDEPTDPDTPPATEAQADVAAPEADAIARQRGIVEVLRFDTELLGEDMKQRQVADAERLYVGGGIRDQIPEKLARLRAKAHRQARRVTDADLAQELKEDVLDPIEGFASALWLQRDAVFRLRNDAEWLKESVRRATEERPAGSSSDEGWEDGIASRLAGVRDQLTWLSSSVTDPELSRELRDHVLDVFDQCARSSCLTSLLEKQREDFERLRFDLELVKEDIRLAQEREAERRQTFSGRVTVPISERLALVRNSADQFSRGVVDRHLARDLDEQVLRVLDELAKSPYAK